MASRQKKTLEVLMEEWTNLKKSWFSVYNWKSLSNVGYSEKIAQILLDNFSKIEISYEGLRRNNFRLASHHGQCQLATHISQLVEKRFCRALFNLKEIPLLGTMLDYEVPFKEVNASKHGDIDLLTLKNDKLFVVEAKIAGSQESVLKAVLEAYVYSSLVNAAKEQFYADFAIDPSVKIAPVVLTFVDSASGRQLREIDKYPNILKLIYKVNNKLAELGIDKLRFMLVNNTKQEVTDSIEARPYDSKCNLLVFKDGFNLGLEDITLS